MAEVAATSSNVGPVPTSCHARGSGIFSLPDPKCSPGALNPDVSQATIGSTICRAGWTKTIRPPYSVTGPEKRVEMRAYGARGSIHSYELDHLVSLELGGAVNSYDNYWPEPNYSNASGFYLNPKDKLENVLRKRVCDGKMGLTVAQKLIATDWMAAYRAYVRP